MNSLGLDFRDGCLKVLSARDGRPVFARTVVNFSVDDPGAKERLSAVLREAGGGKGWVSLILPAGVVEYKVLKLPVMHARDAGKIAEREITRDLKGARFSYGIRTLGGRQPAGAGQEVLAEYAPAGEIIKYLGLLRSCGLTPAVVTGSLEGNIRAFRKYRPQTEGSEALLDIGLNAIEVAVFQNGQLLAFETIRLQQTGDERTSSGFSTGPLDKVRIYRLIDALYNYIVSYGKKENRDKLSKLWLCGDGAAAEGIAESISQGLGLQCGVLQPMEKQPEDGSAYSALYGLLLSDKEKVVNLLPKGYLEEKRGVIIRAVIAAALSVYVLGIFGGWLALSRIEKGLAALHEQSQSALLREKGAGDAADIYVSGVRTFREVAAGERKLYGVFRDLADLTPRGVVLENLKMERREGRTIIKLSARLSYRDESMKDALMSRLLDSLDRSTRLRRTSAPEIAVEEKKPEEAKQISVSLVYEVLS